MSKKYVMGIDGGTGGVRVGIYDLEGRELAFASTEYPTIHPRAGWAEQNPMDWWNCLAKSTKRALSLSGLKKEDIAALSCDGTCGSVVLAKEDGTTLGTSVIWMDVRADEEAKRVSETGHEALRFSGYENVSAEGAVCKAMWVKANRPEDYQNADHICEYVDWLSFMLTRRWTANYSCLASRWYYDAYNGGFPVSLYRMLDIEEVLDMLPSEIHYVGDSLGTLHPDAAEFLGLSADTIVAQGGEDASIGLFGLGVIRPGRIGLITGNSHLILGLTQTCRYERNGLLGPYPEAILRGCGLVEGGLNSSGSILSWFKNNFCRELESLPGGAYAAMDAEAEKIPIGSEGLLVLDWWQGNRAPYADSDIQGTIYGLSLRHTRAHIYRAIMEGVAFGTENVLRAYRQAGFPADEVYISGGTTKSRLWMQIHADVSNVAIHVPKNREAPSLGTAILAAHAAGLYTFEEAVKNMVHYDSVIYPNEQNHAKYQQIFAQYEAAYPAMKDWMHATTGMFRALER